VTRDLQRGTFLDVARPELGDDEIAEVVDTLRSGWLVAGPKVSAFEAALEQRLAPARVRCLSSATAGLYLGLRLAGVGPGDEVILPTLTFAACSNTVELLGATPVFVDSEPSTGLLDLHAVERRLGPRTRAIMPVHLGGRPVDLDHVNALRDAHGVAIVEDAAHAIGAEWGGRPIGTHGNATSFSFHPSKNMTTIEGGALALPWLEEAERVDRLRVQGLSRSAWSRHGSASPADYELDEPGFKLTMTDVAAAIGIHQLAKLDGFIDRREELAQRYDDLLADLPLELEPPPPPGARHGRHLYAVRLAAGLGVDRSEVITGLRDRQIGTSVHFKPLHRFRWYRERHGLSDVDFPVASDYADRTLSLPLHPGMSADDIHDVAAGLAALLPG
jgi:dTDP-4-amino-4,6-dideoxygalactose transaminase